jgi:hypothetical protein
VQLLRNIEINVRKIKHPVRTKNRLSTAIDDLLADIESGDKFMKVYKQMKMYNDDELNPVLYQGKNNDKY